MTALLPAGPSSPALLQSIQFGTDSLAFLKRCHRRHGDTFTIRLAGIGTYVLFSTPQHIKELYTGDPEALRAGEANHSLLGALSGSRTTFVVDGQEHLRRRRILMPPLHGDRMHLYGDIAREVTEETARTWPVGRHFKLLPHLERISLKVILRSVFGLDRDAPRGLAEQLMILADVGVHSILHLFPTLQWDLGRLSPWGRVAHVIREADRLLYQELARRRADPASAQRNDVFALLMYATDEEGRTLTDGELRDELISLLVAGNDTTVTSLAWTIERILSEPEVEARIQSELEDVLGGRPPDATTLARLEYLDATIKEALRVRPITSIAGARKLARPYTIGEHHLPAGVTAAAANLLLHRRPELYPDPEAFRPERFLGKRPDPYEWIPFGGGARRCAGKAFAMYQMKMVLATLLSCYRLRLTTRNLGISQRFLMAPAGGLKVMIVEQRRAATA